MAEQKINRFRQVDFRGGINYEIEAARPDQVEDARNVWARRGPLEQRPGYKGVTTHTTAIRGTSSSAVSAYNGNAAETIFSDITGDFYTMTGTHFYFGWTALSTLFAPNAPYDDPTLAGWYGVRVGVTSTAPGTVFNNRDPFYGEYWNGTEWKYLPVQITQADADDICRPVADSSHYLFHNQIVGDYQLSFTWAMPKDMANKTVNSVANRCWVRIRKGTIGLSGAGIASVGGGAFGGIYPMWAPLAQAQFPTPAPGSGLVGATVLKLSNGKRRYVFAGELGYLSTADNADSSWGFQYTVRSSLAGSTTNDAWFRATTSATDPLTWKYRIAGPHMSAAALSEFDLVYTAIREDVRVFGPTIPSVTLAYNRTTDALTPWLTLNASTIPIVENRPEFVGVFPSGQKAPYHPDYIAQLAQAPEAKYLLWHNSTLFAAGIDGDPHTIRWTAPTSFGLDGYRVWPEVSFETLAEDDPSPITGLSVHDEHVLVWKGDSVYRMVFLGTTPEGLSNYSAVRIRQGIGTLSNASIVQLPIGTAFFYEDGVYLFDGVSFTKKSKPIQNVIAALPGTRRTFAAGVHWAKESCYLLSVQGRGSDVNNMVLVWDYENDAWWVWDNIEAQAWLSDEDEHDNEVLYFCDTFGGVFQLGVGNTDHGATIESYVKTHRFAFKEEHDFNWCETRVMADNKVTSLRVNLIVQDRDADAFVANAKTISFTDPNEHAPEGFVFGSSQLSDKKRRERHVDWAQSRGAYAQVLVTNINKNQCMSISKIVVGATVEEIP